MTAPAVDDVLDAVKELNPDLRANTLVQIRRWTAPFLAWCDETGNRPTWSERSLIDHYEAAHPERFGASRAAVRSNLKKALQACDRVEPARTPRGATFSSRVDALPRGRAKQAALDLQLAAGAGKRRRSIKAIVGRFLTFLEARGIRPEECYEGDLVAYRNARKLEGAHGANSEVSIARDFLRELGVVTKPKRPAPKSVRRPRGPAARV